MKKWYGTLAAVLLAGAVTAEEYQADLVVYGGSVAGIIAAQAAANQGKSVIVVEPTAHLGGMTASGLGQVDIFRPETLGGLTQRYFERAAQEPLGIIYWVTPSGAEQVCLDIVKENDIEVLYESRLKEGAKARMNGTAIAAIELENGDTVAGKMFVDASYEGDLLAAANVSHRIGREGRSEYNESAAGVRPAIELKYAKSYDENGKLYPEIIEAEIGEVGAADDLTQAYNFRLCMTQDKSNFRRIEKPANYNRNDYTNLLLMIKSKPEHKWIFNDIISYWGMLSGETKVDVNNRGDFSTDMINFSHTWATATYAEREEIYQQHKNYHLGLLYFIANDPEVPASLRADASSWGLAADEFKDNDNWPYLLYIREARRLIGEYVMVQDDCFKNNTKPDSIGIGSYMLDSHAVRRFTSNGKVYMEGFISVFDGKVPVRPYEIAYHSIVPKKAECRNLFSVICLSASHVAFCSLRMEPVFMTVGEAAGVAAAMAIDENVAVQDIDVEKLQKTLTGNGGVLHYPGGNMFPLAGELPGILLDNTQAQITGNWLRREVGQPIYNGSYLMSYLKSGPATATYTCEVPEDGNYQVNVIMHRIPEAQGQKMPFYVSINNADKQKYEISLSKAPVVLEPITVLTVKKGDKVEFLITKDEQKIYAVADGIQLLKQ